MLSVLTNYGMYVRNKINVVFHLIERVIGVVSVLRLSIWVVLE